MASLKLLYTLLLLVLVQTVFAKRSTFKKKNNKNIFNIKNGKKNGKFIVIGGLGTEGPIIDPIIDGIDKGYGKYEERQSSTRPAYVVRKTKILEESKVITRPLITQAVNPTPDPSASIFNTIIEKKTRISGLLSTEKPFATITVPIVSSYGAVDYPSSSSGNVKSTPLLKKTITHGNGMTKSIAPITYVQPSMSQSINSIDFTESSIISPKLSPTTTYVHSAVVPTKRSITITSVQPSASSRYISYSKIDEKKNDKKKKENKNKIKFLKKYLNNTDTYITVKKAHHNVCKRPFNKYEESLVKELVHSRKKGLQKYKQNKQRCSKAKSRRRRAVESEFPNLNVTATSLYCINRTKVQDNTLNMCRECVYRITLPIFFHPRFHLHTTCDENGDYSCLMGEGVCMKNVAYIPVLYDADRVGDEKMQQWVIISIPMTKSCSCQVIQGSLFGYFV